MSAFHSCCRFDPFFGSAFRLLAWIEMRPSPPADEIGAVEERCEALRRFRRPAAEPAVQLGDPAHKVVHGKRPCGLEHVPPRSIVVADRLEIEPEVEMGEAALVAAGLLGAGLGGRQHCRWLGAACEEFENLPHRHSRIGTNGNDGLAGGVGTLIAGHAGEVPGDVFDVGRIHGAVEFELPAAVIEATGVVESQASLPELGLAPGPGQDELVEGLRRFNGLGREEEPDGFIEECRRVGRGRGEHRRKAEQKVPATKSG
jgi:hypothetical protein